MFEKNTIARIRACVQGATKISLPYNVEAMRGEGLTVTLEGGCAKIIAQDENALASLTRFWLLAINESKGTECLDRRKYSVLTVFSVPLFNYDYTQFISTVKR